MTHRPAFKAPFKAKKSLGQNFLKDGRVIEKIIWAADLPSGATAVEVGPGMGILTEALMHKAAKVIAIEKDHRLFVMLKVKYGSAKNLELVEGDALEIPPPNVPYYLVANIPYYITSPLLDHFIRENPSNLPERAVLLVQKEVAKKICTQPPDMNVLALHVQTFGKPTIVATVSRNNFSPAPKVDSAILKIDLFKGPKVPHEELKSYFAAIHRGFSQKRKMLRGLFPVEVLQKAGIEETRRAETLQIEEWRKLACAKP